jgi:hypothetical protein
MRLHIIAEGQTEETFVNNTLAIHLGHFNIQTDVRCVMTIKNGAQIHRGGLSKYDKVRFDVTQWIKQDQSPEVRFSTMFDFYALPIDFPGFQQAQKLSDAYDQVRAIENAFRDDIGDYRFIPYIQLHEFEALLFADIRQMEWAFIDQEKQIGKLVTIAQEFENPELINLHQETAPSKRIIAKIPEYTFRKASAGPIVADKIGIQTIRNRCQHFDEWIKRLEGLSQETNGA